MSESILVQIRQAEEEAEAIRKRAQTEARDLIKGAEEALRREERQAAAEQREATAAKLHQAQADIQAQMDRYAQEQKEERAGRMRQARRNLGLASALVYGRIVNHGKD